MLSLHAGRLGPPTVSIPERELGSCCIAQHDLFQEPCGHLFHPHSLLTEIAQVLGQAAWTLVPSRGTSLLSCHWSTWPGALTGLAFWEVCASVPVTAWLHGVLWALLQQGVCIILLSPVSHFYIFITLHLPKFVWCLWLLACRPFPLWPLFLPFSGFGEEGTIILCHQWPFN